MDVMDGSQMPQIGPIKDVMVQTPVWEPFAHSTAMLEVSTKPFHWEGPVAPNRASTFDVVCKVEEGVDGESADWKAFWVPLIINPTVC